jgi:hypothetical protein
VLRSPALKAKLQQALAAQRETSEPSQPSEPISSEETELNRSAADEHQAVIETKIALKDSKKAHKEMLKRKDMVVRKKNRDAVDEHDQQTRIGPQQEADEEERKTKGGGKKRKATAFLSSMLKKSKRVKKDKADQQQKREYDAKAKEAIEQERHNQRVAYIKRRIEERYGVSVRRDSMRSSGKRVRIQEPAIAADGGDAVTVSPATEKDEAAGRRRRAMTMEEVMTGGSETAAAAAASIALAKKPLVKQRSTVTTLNANDNNLVARGAGGDDSKENAQRPLRGSAASPFKTAATITGVSESDEATTKRTTSDPPVTLSSSAGNSRAIYVPRRPLQSRNV